MISWHWTGFKGKTLWDWLQILIIPLVLASGAFYLQIVTEFIAADRQKEQLLTEYLREMTRLLLEHNLREAEENSELRSIANVRTLMTLRGLDGGRKGFLMLFLSKSKLIDRSQPIVSLSGSNLSNADLSCIQLDNADLRNVYLKDAKLYYTKLDGADLTDAVLTGASFKEEELRKAVLCNTALPNGEIENQGCPGKTSEFKDPECE